jgi:hypothetical protein
MGLMTGKTVVVTGASTGLGKASMATLAREGANIVASARTKDKLDAAVAEVTAAGGSAIAVAADMSDDVQVGDMIDIRAMGQVTSVSQRDNGSGEIGRGNHGGVHGRSLSLNATRCTRAASVDSPSPDLQCQPSSPTEPVSRLEALAPPTVDRHQKYRPCDRGVLASRKRMSDDAPQAAAAAPTAPRRTRDVRRAERSRQTAVQLGYIRRRIPAVELLHSEAIEIIDVTPAALASLEAVPVWIR